MDAKKFGAFVAEMRKEKNMTQADLAIKLQVTDKAVSRWERGIGFPDINTLEPLADALEISVLELMKSEKYDDKVSKAVASDVLTDTLNIADIQRKQERKHIAIVVGIAFLFVLTVFLMDSVQWNIGFIVFTGLGVIFPLLCLCAFIGLAGYSLWRKAHHMSCRQTVVVSLALIVALGLFLGIFFLLGALGIFPVPG